MLRGLFVFFSSDSHVVNGCLGDEGCLAFVNTNCKHLKRRSCWRALRGSDDHSGHREQALLLPTQGGGALRGTNTQPLQLALPEDARNFTDLQRIPTDRSWDQACLSKGYEPQSVCFEQIYSQLQILPGGWLLLESLKGFVLETSNTTRSCKQKPHQLFLLLIFTSKPKTKHQAAKNSYQANLRL